MTEKANSPRIEKNATRKKAPTSSIRVPMLIIAIFIFPIIAAWIFFNHTDQWTLKTTNRGTLMQPPINVSSTELVSNDKKITLEAYQGKWSLVYMKEGNCEQSCLDNLYTINQVRFALGKKTNKTTSLFINANKRKQTSLNALIEMEYPGVTSTAMTKSAYQALYKSLPTDAQPSAIGGLYLIDPESYVMMSYPANANPKDILRDLQRLVQG